MQVSEILNSYKSGVIHMSDSLIMGEQVKIFRG